MKHFSEISLIATVSFIGELLHYLIPLPVPSSIYGLLLMLLLRQPLAEGEHLLAKRLLLGELFLVQRRHQAVSCCVTLALTLERTTSMTTPSAILSFSDLSPISSIVP